MPRENDKQRIFSRRALILGGLQGAAFSILAGRLFYLQFMRADEYKTQAENNRIKLQLITPERGQILDRFGLPLATNEKNFRLFIDYSTLKQKDFIASVEMLQTMLPLPEKRYKQLLKTRVSTASMPELLHEHLSWQQVSMIELNLLSLPGMYVDIGQVRHYPLKDEAAHLLGYVGAVSEDDLSPDDPPLMRLPDFKIGKNGVEKMLEDELRGTAGIRQLEVNVRGVPVREVSNRESVPGKNIRLTIDRQLQDYIADYVKEESASAVVMEVDTGNVLALVSMPAFDPNSFSVGISSDEWDALNKNKKNPLMNKAITGQYPPGSTFKMLVGMAGIESGMFNTASSVFCPGHFMLGDHRFNCWKPEGHGTVNFHDAVVQSCDTYFYTVAQRIGIERYAEVARRFGLGQLYNIGLIGEKAGIIPDPEWKMKRFKQRWTGGDTINCSIGQGFVLSTPLQLATMTARMCSGRQVVPRLYVPDDARPVNFDPIAIKESLLRVNLESMIDVVNSEMGTAFGKRIMEPRFAFGGKTGTSQVRRITQRGVDQKTIPWEQRHHALFVGFAPVDKPKYACCVVVEHGGGGSAAAAPVARDILLKIQQLDEARS
ncbi:MAG: penicillin-binding protein 2 [Alphaproteobacteria bacterium]|nr:penicillin-binding protein 2 [Alphaproteobacteria bacterium]